MMNSTLINLSIWIDISSISCVMLLSPPLTHHSVHEGRCVNMSKPYMDLSAINKIEVLRPELGVSNVTLS